MHHDFPEEAVEIAEPKTLSAGWTERQSPKKVLVVDDEPRNRKLLVALLQSEGYLPVEASNGAEALEKVLNDKPDLILLDVMMPDMDGYQVARQIKANPATSNIPIIMVTAQIDRGARLAGLDAGAEEFLTKPVDRAELWLRVRNLLRMKALGDSLQDHSDKLESVNAELETFSYSVSHDLRAPLRHILGFVELLQEDAGPLLSQDSRRHLTTIAQSAKRMADLIDALLSFSRAGHAALQRTDVDLDALVRETIGDFQAETKERNIGWNIQPLPPVQADRALLRAVLVNLLANAVKFTSARAEARIEIGCASNVNGETVIFIRDNGAGFDAQYAGKLFGVFQRLHSQAEFEGTGIGLANVQRIIQRHGGRAWAEGVVDGGATFFFSLPRHLA